MFGESPLAYLRLPVDTRSVNRRLAFISVVAAVCVAAAVTVVYRWDRSGVDVILNAATGSDALVTEVWHDGERNRDSRLDETVQRECGALKIQRAFSYCEDALARALMSGGEANLIWGPHAERFGKPVDASRDREPLDYETYREAFVAVLDAGDDDELIRLIYCVRLGKCNVTHCRPSALPRRAARSLASLNRECAASGHHDKRKALNRGRS